MANARIDAAAHAIFDAWVEAAHPATEGPEAEKD